VKALLLSRYRIIHNLRNMLEVQVVSKPASFEILMNFTWIGFPSAGPTSSEKLAFIVGNIGR